MGLGPVSRALGPARTRLWLTAVRSLSLDNCCDPGFGRGPTVKGV